MGLREKILTAPNLETIVTLLAEGQTYIYASVRTQSAWHNAANRRRVEFGQASEAKKQEKKIEKQEKKESKKAPKRKKYGQE